VQPGTVLLTLVPKEETLRAEVWVSNEDIGFVRQGQPVKLKFAAFPFQKYGMVEGTVEHVSADSADGNTADLTMKERALAKLHEPTARILRYRAPDSLINFLKSF
jgi:multidrug resistance efflux pump